MYYTMAAQIQVSNPSALSSWTSGSLNVCDGSWAGITCTGGSPSSLDLSYQGLAGTLPDALKWANTLTNLALGPGNSFSGTLPLSWSLLTGLSQMALQNNGLLTGALPNTWSSLVSLKSLNLGFDGLSLSIPSSWAVGLTALTRLILTGNANICGPLPGSWTSSKVASGSTLIGSDCSQTSGLLSIKSAVTSSSWTASGLTTSNAWVTGTDPCSGSWTGVSCTSSGLIISLDLSFAGLQGTFPANLSLVSGLQRLSFDGNL